METRFINNLTKKQESLFKKFNEEENEESAVLPLDFKGYIEDANEFKREIYSQEELLLPGIIQNLSEYIWLAVIQDEKLSILYHSPSINRLTGYSPEELRTYPNLWLPSSPASESKKLEEAIRQIKSDRRVEIKLRHQVLLREGKRIWVETHLKSHDALEEPCCLCVSRHFSKTEEEILKLKTALKSAESASKAKSEFLAGKSHEIRTPLSILLGLIELLRDTRLTREQEKYLAIMNSSSEVLLSLLNNTIDISRIESGRMELEEKSFSLGCLIESVSDILGPKASEKSIDILSFIDPALPFYLYGDPARLRQVMLNLLGNAVKFTERGAITISVRAEKPYSSLETSSGRIMARFSVSDTGPGICSTDQKRIFYNFTQASHNKTSKHTGAGMGLNISKAIIEMMGGKIWVQSKLNRGATFHFTVPLGHGDKSEKKFSHALSKIGSHYALIVTDNPSRASTVRNALDSPGIKVEEAPTADKAIALLKERSPDTLLIDLDLSGSGLELAKKVRREKKFDSIAIVFIFARGIISPSLIKGLDVSGVITKPFKRSEIFKIIKKIAGVSSAEKKSIKFSKKPAHSPKGARILLVDDNPESCLITESILVKAGYFVDITSNGKEALTAVQKHLHSLVIMDMNMPVMDGFETTGKIRAIEDGHDRLPVIALSACALAESRKKAFEMGIDDYVTKPVKSNTLLAKVEKWIDSRNSEKSIPANPGFRYEAPELDDLKRRFIVNRRADLDKIKILLAKESYTEIERIGHDIKGLGYAFGYHRISRVGDAMEQAASICNSQKISDQAEILSHIISKEEGCYSDDEPNNRSPLLLSK